MKKVEPFKIIMKASLTDKDNLAYSSVNQVQNYKFLNFSLYNHLIRECEFYTLFNKNFPVPIPKVYYIQTPNPEQNIPCIILMENLADKGIVLDYDAYVREEQVLSVVENIAKLHAYAISNEDVWKEKFTLPKSSTSIDQIAEWIKKSADLRPGFLDALLGKLGRFGPIASKANEGRDYAKKWSCRDLGRRLFNF